LDVALAQRSVGEQQLAHRRCITSAVSVRHSATIDGVTGGFQNAFFSIFSAL
jgi:hypothetical protein